MNIAVIRDYGTSPVDAVQRPVLRLRQRRGQSKGQGGKGQANHGGSGSCG